MAESNMHFSTKVKNVITTKLPFMKGVVQSMADEKNRARYREQCKNEPIRENVVLFMSFMGKKYADSPRAIYEYMISNDKYADYQFVWAFVQPDKYRFLEQNPRTILVKHNSDEHYKYYGTAKYWITNSRVPDVIPTRDEQVYVQCWHGTPLKRLGLDVNVSGANVKHSMKDIKKLYVSDAMKYSHMISPSRFCTEKYISAFGLDRVGREDIVIEEGYPRNDFLKNYTQEDVDRIKEKLELPKDKKVILYAPTWRENQYSGTVGYTYNEELNFHDLREKLGDEYIVLFRTHYFVSSIFDFELFKGFVYDVSGYDEINDLYVISDMLVTDYSSVFFDYANLHRPILFYMYDLKEYRDEIRGFYIPLEELPGPIIETTDKLAEEILKIKDWERDEKYIEFNKKYNPLDDGKASERVAEVLFNK